MRNSAVSSSMESLKSKVTAIKEKSLEQRAPIIIEFTGSPESGKTTSINYMIELFESFGLNVLKLREPAEYCPIIKKSDEDKVKFNDWTFKESVKNLHKAKNTRNLDIVLCDRGVWDNLVWYKLYENLGLITNEHYEKLFFNQKVSRLVDMMYVLKTSPSVSIQRKGGKQGKVVNQEFLARYNNFIDMTYNHFEQNINHVNLINTDGYKDVNVFKNFVAYKVMDDVYDKLCNKRETRAINIEYNDKCERCR